MRRGVFGAFIVAVATFTETAAQSSFDHEYRSYARLLAKAVKGERVDYRALVAERAAIDATIAAFGRTTADEERRWSRADRLAYWINAYNLFTLDAVVDRYPVSGSVFSLHPRNSIRQIEGVWTKLTWRAAGRDVTLDGIEHGIIRKEFREPLIHFAVNCASISCPPLRAEPYLGATLTAQLEDAARRYLASSEGAQTDGRGLRVSSLFKWYGADFVERFAASGPKGRDETERAVLAFVQQYGPTSIAALTRNADNRLAHVRYNWALNDVAP